MKDITTYNSQQYKFINQINNKNTQEFFGTLKLGNYNIINNTLFKQENEEYILVGIIKSISLEESKLMITLNTDKLIDVNFESNKEALVYRDYKMLFKKYMGVDLKDELYEDLNEKDIKEMYKAVVYDLHNEVEKNV